MTIQGLDPVTAPLELIKAFNETKAARERVIKASKAMIDAHEITHANGDCIEPMAALLASSADRLSSVLQKIDEIAKELRSDSKGDDSDEYDDEPEADD